MRKKGIDISYHQGNIHFNSVKKSGIEFVILREGYRDSVDKKFFEYVKKAKEVGIPVIGVYHFSYALNEKQAKEEADFCIKNMKTSGLGKDVIVFFDFEYDTVKKAAAKGVTLKSKQCNKHTLAFCERVKELGYIPGVYTNLDYYRNWYEKDTISKYHIWLADYSGGPDIKCLLQQYTSSGTVSGISGKVDMNYYYGEDFKISDEKVLVDKSTDRSRTEVVKLAKSWIGKKESDGSHKLIIDIYNTIRPLPRGYKVKYTDAWCASTWSAIAQKLGYTDIMPVECSCVQLISKAKSMGIWVENDGYVPSPGDAVLYDWDDSGKGDDTGSPEHVGTVYKVFKDDGYFTVIEGNYKNAVKVRTVSINGKFIRGFITPKYTINGPVNTEIESKSEPKKSITTIAREVISGEYGDGDIRKKKLEDLGYDYKEVQAKVNSILNDPAKSPKKRIATCKAQKFNEYLAGVYETTANLYCRNDAGNNKKALCLIPKGTKVHNYGYYSVFKGTKWLYITFTLNGVEYTGFSSSKYLKK